MRGLKVPLRGLGRHGYRGPVTRADDGAGDRSGGDEAPVEPTGCRLQRDRRNLVPGEQFSGRLG